MNRLLVVFVLNVALAGQANSQPADPDPEMNNPDKASWGLFTLVNRPARDPK